MTYERLDAIRARCDAAWPGPWDFRVGNMSDRQPFEVLPKDADYKYGFESEGDARFIAAAREDIPALLDYIDKAINHSHGQMQYIAEKQQEKNKVVYEREELQQRVNALEKSIKNIAKHLYHVGDKGMCPLCIHRDRELCEKCENSIDPQFQFDYARFTEVENG